MNKFCLIGKSSDEQSIFVSLTDTNSKKYLRNGLNRFQNWAYNNFSFIWKDEHLGRINYFLNNIAKILSKTLKRIKLSNLFFSRKEIRAIFNCSLGWEKLILYNCRLPGEEFDIDYKGKSKLEELSLWGTGNQHRSNWGQHPEKFRNLIKSISRSPLKDSLNLLIIFEWKISKEEWECVLKSFQMRGVEVKYDYK